MSDYEILVGDCRELLATLPERSVQCVVTSPPYFGLRDYGADGQIGLEPTPDAYVAELVEVFRGVRRVLRDDGTVWLNLGDSYSSGDGQRTNGPQTNTTTLHGVRVRMPRAATPSDGRADVSASFAGMPKPKDLVGIPWRVAFALQADGWYLRSDIIWHKPNPMPESVTDRPTKSHEYIFLLTKSERYHYDHAAIAEPAAYAGTMQSFATPAKYARVVGGERQRNGNETPGAPPVQMGGTRNKRSVWTVATAPYPEAHFATYPPELIRPCVQAGAPEGSTVLDPFNGAGTTGLVALQMNRRYIGIELNPTYASLTRDRLAPLANQPKLFAVAS
jgi:DNA modification methylase